MSKRNSAWPMITLAIGAYLLVISLPNSWKTWMPGFMQPTLHLGLDLQGGTQLDFRVSEAEMAKQIDQLHADISRLEKDNGPPDEIADKKSQIANIQSQRRNIVEAIRTVLERRINSLGVSEAVITPSYYGDEKHLLVECPGVVDVQKCIATVGKTILLEFKEQYSGEDELHAEDMKKLAEAAYRRISESGETLETVGQDLGTTLGVVYSDSRAFFKDDFPEDLSDVWDMTVDDPVIYREITLPPINTGDKEVENRGIMIIEVIGDKTESDRIFNDPTKAIEYLAETRDELSLVKKENVPIDNLEDSYRESMASANPGTILKVKGANGKPGVIFVTGSSREKDEIEASHILIAYKGAVRADTSITRSRDDAKELAYALVSELDNGAGFGRLARENSDGPSGKNGGSLGKITRGQMTKAFEDAAFSLKKGEISDPIETEFGFHIIRADSDPEFSPATVSYMELLATGDDSSSVQEEVFNSLQNRLVSKPDVQIPIRSLFFSFLPTGWKDTPLDGKHFRRATVTTNPVSGIPVVQITFDKEGGDLFYELTKRNLNKPIAIFVGGELVSAPVVQSEIPGGVAIITGSSSFDEANRLAQDLNTGAIPAPIHLVGQVTVEATLGAVALRTSLKAALLGFLLVGIYMIWYYRVLGMIASIALVSYAIIFAALLKLPVFLFTDQYIVLTLAGIAGIILSIGMAVDANVLIFERMKEELKKGKMLQTAADIGFKRAWSSIRDSNVSTLLTASILFIIGTSIVRGFAVTLSIGIIISLFTAIVVTRFLITMLYKSPISENMAAFGIDDKLET